MIGEAPGGFTTLAWSSRKDRCNSPESPFNLGGLPFDRDLWRILVGELLLSSAVRLPELETPLETFAALLGHPLAEVRTLYCPIQQAILGSQDLRIGSAYYRPDFAGWNSSEDVSRLAGWLATIAPDTWSSADLPMHAEGDRDDELAFAREWFPELAAMYRNAERDGLVVVSEWI